MLRCFIISLLLFAMASGCHKALSQVIRTNRQEPEADSATFTFIETNHGMLRTSDHIIINNTDSPGGTHKITNNYVFTKTTDTIPAVLHISFGSEFFLKSGKDTVINLKMLWKFPGKMINKQNKVYEEYAYIFPCYTNQLSFASYEFDEYFEVKPGLWQLLILHNNEVIYSNYFYLVLPV